MKVFVWILLCLIWGTTWIFIKMGLADIPPISFAALRFTIAILILIPIILIRKIEFPQDPEIWKIIGITGVLQFALNYGMLFWGEQYISSGLAAVLQAAIPAFGLFLAKIYLAESITPRKILALSLGFVGVMIIFWEQLEINGIMAFWGSLAVVVGAFGAAYASVLTKAKLQNFNPAVLLFGQSFFGVIPLWIAALTFEKLSTSNLFSTNAIVCLLYLSIVGSIVAFWLYYWLLSKIEVSKAMMIAIVTPLIAIIVGAATIGEKMPPQSLLGGGFIISSVILIILKRS
jgi:drug/metabolite transporter (DMT)-like permease